MPPMVIDTEAEEAALLDTITMSSSKEQYIFRSPGSDIPMDGLYIVYERIHEICGSLQ